MDGKYERSLSPYRLESVPETKDYIGAFTQLKLAAAGMQVFRVTQSAYALGRHTAASEVSSSYQYCQLRIPT